MDSLLLILIALHVVVTCCLAIVIFKLCEKNKRFNEKTDCLKKKNRSRSPVNPKARKRVPRKNIRRRKSLLSRILSEFGFPNESDMSEATEGITTDFLSPVEEQDDDNKVAVLIRRSSTSMMLPSSPDEKAMQHRPDSPHKIVKKTHSILKNRDCSKNRDNPSRTPSIPFLRKVYMPVYPFPLQEDHLTEYKEISAKECSASENLDSLPETLKPNDPAVVYLSKQLHELKTSRDYENPNSLTENIIDKMELEYIQSNGQMERKCNSRTSNAVKRTSLICAKPKMFSKEDIVSLHTPLSQALQSRSRRSVKEKKSDTLLAAKERLPIYDSLPCNAEGLQTFIRHEDFVYGGGLMLQKEEKNAAAKLRENYENLKSSPETCHGPWGEKPSELISSRILKEERSFQTISKQDATMFNVVVASKKDTVREICRPSALFNPAPFGCSFTPMRKQSQVERSSSIEQSKDQTTQCFTFLRSRNQTPLTDKSPIKDDKSLRLKSIEDQSVCETGKNCASTSTTVVSPSIRKQVTTAELGTSPFLFTGSPEIQTSMAKAAETFPGVVIHPAGPFSKTLLGTLPTKRIYVNSTSGQSFQCKADEEVKILKIKTVRGNQMRPNQMLLKPINPSQDRAPECRNSNKIIPVTPMTRRSTVRL